MCGEDNYANVYESGYDSGYQSGYENGYESGRDSREWEIDDLLEEIADLHRRLETETINRILDRE